MLCKNALSTRFLASCAILPWLATPLTAYAQASTATPANAQALAPAQDEIIVTAQKRAESAQKVPISLTVVSAASLASHDINEVDQLTLVAPSLQLGADNSFAIRGVGTLAFSANLDSSVAVALDDVNLALPTLAANLLNDVSRVEVLYGPQGLLFGRNATSGLINVVSNRPALGHLEVSADAEYDYRDTAPGTSDGVLVHGVLNMPTGQNSALRVNAFYENQRPFTQYVGGGAPEVQQGSREYGARAKFLFQPSDALELYVIGDYSEHHGIAGFSDETYRQLGPNSGNTGPIALNHVTPGTGNLQYAGDGSFYRDLETGGLQANASYKFGNGFQITDIAAWKTFRTNNAADTDYTSLNGASTNHDRQKFNQYSNELRLTTPSNDLISGQVGLFFMHTSINDQLLLDGNDYFPSFLLPQFPFCVGATNLGAPPAACPVSNVAFLGLDTTSAETTNSYAAFGQLTLAVTKSLRGIFGARVTHDHNHIVTSQDQLNYFLALGGAAGTFPASESDTNFSYKVGAEYDVVRDVMAYASYSTGYKGPGFTSKVSLDASQIVLPETNEDIELGIKSQFFNRKLTLNASLFHSKYKNYQSQSFNTLLRTFVTQNAASATTQGAEFFVELRPTTGLTISASESFLKSKFNNFPGAQCYLFQPGCAVNGTFNAGGLTTPTAPKFTSSISARYEHPVARGVNGFIDLSEYHRSSVNFTINQVPGAGIGATDILGASIGIAADGGLWTASIFCKNCADQRVPATIGLEAGDQSNGTANTYLQQFGYDSFRTIGVRVGMQF